ncbi:hypothetical protein HDU97_004671 [Phlyctochytrium planicorne]|nr:hypothetical protein HDU97_004671 [Phlyctochytrium planicorne]
MTTIRLTKVFLAPTGTLQEAPRFLVHGVMNIINGSLWVNLAAVLATLFAPAASRLLALVGNVIATFTGNLHFMIYTCERKNSFLSMQYAKGDRGPTLSLSRIFINTLVQVLFFSSGFFVALAVQVTYDQIEVRRALETMFMMQGQAISKSYMFGQASQESFWILTIVQIGSERLIPRINPILSIISANWKARQKNHRTSPETSKPDPQQPNLGTKSLQTSQNNLKEPPTYSSPPMQPANPKSVEPDSNQLATHSDSNPDSPSTPRDSETSDTQPLTSHNQPLHDKPQPKRPSTTRHFATHTLPIYPEFTSKTSLEIPPLTTSNHNESHYTLSIQPEYASQHTHLFHPEPTSKTTLTTQPALKPTPPHDPQRQHFHRNEFMFISLLSTLSSTGFILIFPTAFISTLPLDYIETIQRALTFNMIQLATECTAMLVEFKTARVPYGQFQRMSWMIVPTFMICVAIVGTAIWIGQLCMFGYGV